MIKVLLYEDNPQLREGLGLLIDGTPGYQLLASYKDPLNAANEVEAWKPDVVLMDIDMPGMNGIEALKKVKQQNPDAKVLMLTVFDDNKYVFEAIRHGAIGYVLKKTAPAKLLEHISDAASGGAPMTSSIAAQVLKMFAGQQAPSGESFNLSEREKEVLQHLVEGDSYKMIAAGMFISLDTVRSHIKKIYEKLHVNSKSEAVAKALTKKIL
jgi:DNA-binding NarL/FixJ family response regulator